MFTRWHRIKNSSHFLSSPWAEARRHWACGGCCWWSLGCRSWGACWPSLCRCPRHRSPAQWGWWACTTLALRAGCHHSCTWAGCHPLLGKQGGQVGWKDRKLGGKPRHQRPHILILANVCRRPAASDYVEFVRRLLTWAWWRCIEGWQSLCHHATWFQTDPEAATGSGCCFPQSSGPNQQWSSSERPEIRRNSIENWIICIIKADKYKKHRFLACLQPAHLSVKSSHLSVVVGWHLSHRTSQLGHLHLPLVIPLEATVQHFPLAWFQTWYTR